MGLAVALKKRVKGFSLDVEWAIGSELAVLFGPSGAGKSMTLQMIAGLMTPDEGRVAIDGTVMFSSAGRIDVPPHKRHLGYVFQDLALFPHMTVSGNISYGANGMPKGERRQRVAEMLSAFRLEGLEDKLPSEISGGQKQRVAFARALIRRPPALLLDEPFSSLDAPLRQEMRVLLQDIRRDFGIPIVLVTHDGLEARSLADTIIIYSGGRIAQQGPPAQVFSAPATEEVRRLVSPLS